MLLFSKNFFFQHKEEIIFMLIGISIVLFIKVKRNFKILKINSKKKEYKLFEEREVDLKRIEKSLENIDLIGIDSGWGTGKTFLIDNLLKKLNYNNKCEYIMLSLLNVNKEDIFPLIIKQLEKILNRNGIFNFYYKKLNEFMGKQSLKGINLASIFYDSKTLKETLEEYKKSILSLNKKIIIVFDDLDRIKEDEKIKFVLNLGVEFSQENIKFIYLYDQKELEKTNKIFNKEFMEKFIPYNYVITPISFSMLLEYYLKEEKYCLLKEDLEFISMIFSDLTWGNKEKYYFLNGLGRIFGFLGNLYNINHIQEVVTPRKIIIFLDEILLHYSIKEEYNLDMEARIIISYLFIKIFLKVEYEKILKLNNLKYDFPVIYKFDKIEIYLDEIDFLYFFLENKEQTIFTIDQNSKNIKIGNKFVKMILINESWTNEKIRKIESKLKITLEIEFDSKEHLFKLKKNSKIDFQKTIKKFSLEEKSYSNLFIRIIFEQYLFANVSPSKVDERLDAINSCIKKLNFLGEKNYLSAYKTAYNYLKKILENDNILMQRKEYFKMQKRYYNDKNLKGIFYVGVPYYLVFLEILKIFGTLQEEYRYLKLLLKIENNKITDKYIEILCESRCIKKLNFNLKIIDILIEKEFLPIQKKIIKIFLNEEIKVLEKNFQVYFKPLDKNFLDEIELIIEVLNELKEKFKLFTIKKMIDKNINFFEKLKTIKLIEDKKNINNFEIGSIKTKYIYEELMDDLKNEKLEEIEKKIEEEIEKEKFEPWVLEDMYNKILEYKIKKTDNNFQYFLIYYLK